MGRKRGVDASEADRSDAPTKAASIAVGGADDLKMSEAVAQFYTGTQQDSGALKVFTHYRTSLSCVPVSSANTSLLFKLTVIITIIIIMFCICSEHAITEKS